jgi:hypothetical protein
MADYCTVAEVKALLPESGLDVNFDFDTMLGILVTSASRMIDKEVGVDSNYFATPSSDSSTRYYDGNGRGCVYIGDWQSVSAVAVSEEGGLASSDYTAWSSSDYITAPYNVTPIYELHVDTLNGSKLYFEPYRKAVKVTGVWGYSATPPADVALAAKIQTVRLFQRSKQMFSTSGAADAGEMNFTALDPDVAQIVSHYRLRLTSIHD